MYTTRFYTLDTKSRKNQDHLYEAVPVLICQKSEENRIQLEELTNKMNHQSTDNTKVDESTSIQITENLTNSRLCDQRQNDGNGLPSAASPPSGYTADPNRCECPNNQNIGSIGNMNQNNLINSHAVDKNNKNLNSSQSPPDDISGQKNWSQSYSHAPHTHVHKSSRSKSKNNRSENSNPYITAKNKLLGLRDVLTGSSLQKRRTTAAAEPRGLGQRLGKKLYLINHRTKSHDMAMWWSLTGVALMVMDAEIFLDKKSLFSILIRCVISTTTFISVGFLLQFQFDERRIFKEDNSLQSWHTVLLSKTTLYYTLEILMFCMHPAPFEIFGLYQPHYPYEFLAVVMFFRLFLPVRSLILHSQYFNSTRVQMLGALNNMNTGTLCNENVSFIIRHQMATHAGTIIGSSLVVIWQIFAWILYTSEKYYQNVENVAWEEQRDKAKSAQPPLPIPDKPEAVIKVHTHRESLYLIPITMMSIGYGDYYPVSPIGRTICCIAGVAGLICTAILIAVLSRKLQMTRRERYLHKAMIEARFHSDVENKAACVLQTAWKSYKRAKRSSHVQNVLERRFSNSFRPVKKQMQRIGRRMSMTNDDSLQSLKMEGINNSVNNTKGARDSETSIRYYDTLSNDYNTSSLIQNNELTQQTTAPVSSQNLLPDRTGITNATSASRLSSAISNHSSQNLSYLNAKNNVNNNNNKSLSSPTKTNSTTSKSQTASYLGTPMNVPELHEPGDAEAPKSSSKSSGRTESTISMSTPSYERSFLMAVKIFLRKNKIDLCEFS